MWAGGAPGASGEPGDPLIFVRMRRAPARGRSRVVSNRYTGWLNRLDHFAGLAPEETFRRDPWHWTVPSKGPAPVARVRAHGSRRTVSVRNPSSPGRYPGGARQARDEPL